jgi:protoporphyrinogen oxidase
MRTSTPKRSISKNASPPTASNRWSASVTKHSDALDLQAGVFRLKKPKSIARSLKRSAEHSTRRKASPYCSALSMLVFYINRAGKNLPAARRKTLERAKVELRKLFGKAEDPKRPRKKTCFVRRRIPLNEP